MLLHDWLTKLESTQFNKIELGLKRIQEVAQRCGITQRLSCPVITVAGTNGKGTSVACLEEIYVAGGYQVGSYTSPHLSSFNERIKLNLQPVDDEAIISAFELIKKEQGPTHLTYFEYSTLAALIIFQKVDLDVVLLEVGMGGRLDCCNIIDPDCALITSISLDHTDLLGDTREQIGFEKAGIMRPNIPVVCADPNPPQSIINHADKLNAKLTIISKAVQSNPTIHPNNIAGVRLVVDVMRKFFPIDDGLLDQVLSCVRVAGRQQKKNHICEWLFDVAHNIESIQFLADQLNNAPIKSRTFAIVGMLADKAIVPSLRAISDEIDSWHVIALNTPRTATPNVLCRTINEISGINANGYLSAQQCVEDVLQRITPDDRVVVFGSFLTVASVTQTQPFSLGIEQ